MEAVTGIRFTVEPTAESISRCSELSGCFLSALVRNHPVTFNQILYPYADALSLSGRPGTESTRIFGTHLLLHNVECAAALAESLPCGGPDWELVELPVCDGAVMSSDVAEFLRAGAECSLPSVGNFPEMLGGFVSHWRIRECARLFASFSEMSYRRAGGEIVGLLGGRLILTPQCDCQEVLSAIFTQKTGVRSGGR